MISIRQVKGRETLRYWKHFKATYCVLVWISIVWNEGATMHSTELKYWFSYAV